MHMPPFFSIILPIYNVAPYLERCIQSILAQDFSDYEMILVDDGSTDGGLLLCKSLAELDSRIRVIHKENGGVSSARNLGIREATGSYICYTDIFHKYAYLSFSTAAESTQSRRRSQKFP